MKGERARGNFYVIIETAARAEKNICSLQHKILQTHTHTHTPDE